MSTLAPTLALLLTTCAPMVSPDTMAAVMSVESSHNPYAIGVVGGHLQRQPRNLSEAVATARELEASGWNYSVGYAQVNRSNFDHYGLSLETAFEPCRNLNVGGQILQDCYRRSNRQEDPQAALRQALSCYYSGRHQSTVGRRYAEKVFRVGRRMARTESTNN